MGPLSRAKWTSNSAAADTSSASSIASLRVVPATVMYAMPAYNVYVVRPHHSVAMGPFIVASASTGATQYQDGVACPESYTPGTLVMLGVPDMPRTDGAVRYAENHAIILGAFALMPNTKDLEQHPNIYTDALALVDCTNNRLGKSAMEATKQPFLAREHSYGQCPVDMLPGDFIRHSPFGCGVLVSMARASLYGGPLARIDFDPLDQRCALFAQTFSSQSLFSDDGHYPDKDETHFHERRAYTLNEGTGAISGAAYREEPRGKSKIWVPLEDGQVGVFRRETHEGLIADGLWTFHEIPEDAQVRTRTTTSKPPLGVFSERVFYDGRRETRSALGYSMIKAPWVPVLREKEREDDPERTLQADAAVGKPYREYVNLTEDEYSELSASLMTDEFKYNMEQVYGRRPRGRTSNWKIPSQSEVEGEYKLNQEKTDTELSLLDENANAYPAETPATVTDPGTKESVKVYSATAGIRVLPDGTVTITDGWGGEIRMSRGNITITCPGDIRSLPGRDSVELVPRNKIINAGVDLCAEASNGSMYLKAEHSLKALAGNSGTGALVLEGRGRHDGKDPAGAINSGSELNGGVVIKTPDGLALLAERVHIGPRDDDSRLKAGLARTGRCDVMIDAGKGVLNLAGATGYFKFDTGMALLCGSDIVRTAIGMTSDKLDLFSDRLGLCAGVVRVDKGSPTQTPIQRMDKGGLSMINFKAASKTSFKVGGETEIQGNLRISGKLTENTGVSMEPVSPQPLTDAANAFGLGFPTSRSTSAKIHTGAYEGLTGFYWREESAGYWAADVKFYSARWQVMLKDGGYWSEPVVKSPDGSKDTHAWPGREAWTGGTAYVEMAATGVIKTGLDSYKTSVKTQEEHK